MFAALASISIMMSNFGVDPEIVFTEECVGWTRSPNLIDGLAITSSRTPSKSTSAGRCLPEPLIGNRQSVSHDMQSLVDRLGFTRLLEDPNVTHFIEEMNPFARLDFQTLPEYYDPFGWQMGTGSKGRQGFRLGSVSYNEVSLLPATQAFGTTGNMKIVEWNSNVRFSRVIQPGILFNLTTWLDGNWWDGPGGINLPGQVDQYSTDLELGFFNDRPWSCQIAFHPQIVRTYGVPLDGNAFNFDGRAIATYQASPQWSFVFGVAIWDRVDTMVVPHVGVIWTPDSRWEIRALFPNSRVSYFLGNWRKADMWIYGQYEYTADSWQAYLSEPQSSERIQLTDDRMTLGLRLDEGRYSFFTEAGYVFDRQAKFAGSSPAFNLGETGMIRFGVRY